MSCCECGGGEHKRQGSILFSILNRSGQSSVDPVHPLRSCSCASEAKLVAIRAPRVVFKAASEVLLKTFRFVKNIPCFRGLPAEDQLRLVRNSWAPLLVLGMAQDSVDFDTVETRQPSLLHQILTHSKERQRRADPSQDPGVPESAVEGIKALLAQCGKLSISVREHAFIKGAILFNPEVTELECRDYVQELHREAQCALYEHVRTAHRSYAHRFSRLSMVVNTLRSMNADVVGGLFFRPVTGTCSIDEVVLALFYE